MDAAYLDGLSIYDGATKLDAMLRAADIERTHWVCHLAYCLFSRPIDVRKLRFDMHKEASEADPTKAAGPTRMPVPDTSECPSPGGANASQKHSEIIGNPYTEDRYLARLSSSQVEPKSLWSCECVLLSLSSKAHSTAHA